MIHAFKFQLAISVQRLRALLFQRLTSAHLAITAPQDRLLRLLILAQVGKFEVYREEDQKMIVEHALQEFSVQREPLIISNVQEVTTAHPEQ